MAAKVSSLFTVSLLALVFGGGCDVGIGRTGQKLVHLFQCFDLLNIHDDVHPAIMDEASPFVQTHFMLESRHLVQAHFILEEASYVIITLDEL